MVTDLRYSGIVELRNSGTTEGQGKSNIAPTFSKRGYNYDGQESPTLHIKFRKNRPAGSGEDF